MSCVYLLQYKLETFDNFRKLKALAKKQSGKCIKALCTDRGSEFLSNELNHFRKESGVYK